MATDRLRVLIYGCSSFTTASLLNALDSASHFEVVACVRTWDELLDSTYRLVPHLLIIDTDCDDSFEQILKDFKAEFDCAALAISRCAELERAMISLKAGASGYFLKSNINERLCEAAEAVAKGNAWMDSAIAGNQAPPKALDRETRAAFDGSKLAHIELTAREQQLLQYVMTGLSKTQVAERLNITVDEVLSNEKRLMQKLAVPDSTMGRRPGFERK